jgi:hypothetical protein
MLIPLTLSQRESSNDAFIGRHFIRIFNDFRTRYGNLHESELFVSRWPSRNSSAPTGVVPTGSDVHRLLARRPHARAMPARTGCRPLALRSERFHAKWKPVRVKKTRQIKNLEPRFDSIEAERL